MITPPLDRRLVVFSALTTMHRVTPFKGSERVCINLWFDGDIAQPFPALLSFEDYDERAAKIVRVLRKTPAELRAFCKVWYQDETAHSFRESFAKSAELDAVLS